MLFVCLFCFSRAPAAISECLEYVPGISPTLSPVLPRNSQSRYSYQQETRHPENLQSFPKTTQSIIIDDVATRTKVHLASKPAVSPFNKMSLCPYFFSLQGFFLNFSSSQQLNHSFKDVRQPQCSKVSCQISFGSPYLPLILVYSFFL